MWRCKKCGGEIIADYEDGVLDGGNVIFDKNKGEELVDFAISYTVANIFCENCGNSCNDVDNLEEIAEWEEE